MRYVAAAGLLIAIASAVLAAQAPGTFDVLITGGRVVDGTGAPWFAADVAVSGGRIARVGQLPNASARTRIDAAGLVVAPGFIDMLGQSEFNLLVDNRAASKLLQGVTTELTGEGASITTTCPPTNISTSSRTGGRWGTT